MAELQIGQPSPKKQFAKKNKLPSRAQRGTCFSSPGAPHPESAKGGSWVPLGCPHAASACGLLGRALGSLPCSAAPSGRHLGSTPSVGSQHRCALCPQNSQFQTTKTEKGTRKTCPSSQTKTPDSRLQVPTSYSFTVTVFTSV